MRSVERTSSRQAQSRLVKLFLQLDDMDRTSLLAFAEFLVTRKGQAFDDHGWGQVPEPKAIDRPKGESVVAAIRRLSASYYMLDRGPLLNHAASLMAAHVVQGRPAATVIDELEVLFADSYKKFLENNTN